VNYVVYIAKTARGRYYVGQTKHREQREKEHGRKHGAAFLRGRQATIVYVEFYATLTEARGREQQLKGWSRNKKTALITGNIRSLQTLARSSSAQAR
jgi:predicted GIY-YIG superfamily endonuclease